MTVEDGTATITFARHLPYPVEAVWSALTDPAERAAWFGETTLEPREGGLIGMVPDDPPLPPARKRMTGRILVWDPPRVLEHEWTQQVLRQPGAVRYELTPADGGTLLRFTHRGLTVGDANGFIPGSHAYLDRLAAHLAGAEIPDWSTRYSDVEPEYVSR